jgi:hypothetical protein
MIQEEAYRGYRITFTKNGKYAHVYRPGDIGVAASFGDVGSRRFEELRAEAQAFIDAELSSD